MVLAFLISTMQQESATPIYSATFDRDPDIATREERKDLYQRLSQKVASEYDAVKRYTNRSDAGDFERLRNDNILPEFSRGVVYLDSSEYLMEDKILLWFAALDCGFVMVLHRTESVQTAVLNMKILIQNLQQYTRILTDPVAALLKMERTETVVHHLIPNGVLQLQASALLKETLKELDRKLQRLIKER
ncbi:hypothetical protein RvY_15776 [Ramazzottius varieornatus]|uniref:AP complex mu/sigma subunit domain-containing protein n=1 Tax=Ramazzottius varieornatus TaxID=947166 RepID=A0A1D1VZ69_RAMVA|nr:hypothetical protein RvY_15776 [Ramazzottius varieornatus]